ncbi:MAG: hydrogenase maturation nickel metallochaperone HypA [Bacteroidales bacterium]|jgi:hydrogenase nickel incorporation protein HypA/HybF|nr:hydrogenase maturation nickel metallochaperone HypA [Bacteroidales bacterium]
MHELRIATDLAEIVERYASEAGWQVVEKVNLTFGQFIQVVPDLFEAAFREATRGTVAAGAEIDIEIIPAEMRCLGCGAPYIPAGDLHACKSCGSEEIDLIHGKELYIKSIEGG